MSVIAKPRPPVRNRRRRGMRKVRVIHARRAIRAEIKRGPVFLQPRRCDKFIFQCKPCVVSGESNGVILRHCSTLRTASFSRAAIPSCDKHLTILPDSFKMPIMIYSP